MKRTIKKSLWGLLFSVASVCAYGKASKDIKQEKAACEKGNLGACMRLAEHYEKAKDREAAVPYYRYTCRGGVESSCLALGHRTETRGKLQEALRWFRQACRMPKSSGHGCAEVARIAQDKGATNDAARWKAKACSRGHQPSCS